MKVTGLLIGTITLCILFSGITVATENPHEQITIEGVGLQSSTMTPISGMELNMVHATINQKMSLY